MAKKVFSISFFVAHVLAIAFVGIVLLMPDARENVPGSAPLLCAAVLIEVVYLLRILHGVRKKTFSKGVSDIMVIVWIVFIAWELATTKTAALGIVLYPSPENVFAVYPQYAKQMLENAVFSLEVLGTGFLGGILVGIVLGLIVGWVPRLRCIFYPIAMVMAPIPPMIYAPYLIILMPTFRIASIVLVGILIFMFTFLEMVSKVGGIDKNIIDSARTMSLSTPEMIFRVLLPYSMPGIVNSLKINLTMAFMMLMFAETMATTRGLGCWIIINNNYANYANVVAGFIEIGVVIIVLNWNIGIVQEKAIRWK